MNHLRKGGGLRGLFLHLPITVLGLLSLSRQSSFLTGLLTCVFQPLVCSAPLQQVISTMQTFFTYLCFAFYRLEFSLLSNHVGALWDLVSAHLTCFIFDHTHQHVSCALIRNPFGICLLLSPPPLLPALVQRTVCHLPRLLKKRDLGVALSRSSHSCFHHFLYTVASDHTKPPVVLLSTLE